MTSADDTPSLPPAGSQRVDEFMALYTRHASWLRGYVVALVPNWADAEEVLQNANAILWKKFDQFTPNTDFFAWASQIARNEVLHYRRSKGRDRVRFDDEFIQAVADEAANIAGELNDMRETLAHCLQKLPPKDRQLIDERYRPGASTRSAAQTFGRSVDAVYKALTRIRKVLLECVERQLRGDIAMMPTDSPRQQLYDLVSQLCDGDISHEQEQSLAALVLSDVELRRAYLRYAMLHACLHEHAAKPQMIACVSPS